MAENPATVAGALVVVWFFAWVRSNENAGEEPLLSPALFRNRTSNLGLVTQNAQWLAGRTHRRRRNAPISVAPSTSPRRSLEAT